MRKLTRWGLGTAALTTAMMAVSGCPDGGVSGTGDLAMATQDLTLGGGGGGGDLGFQLPDIGPLADLKGSAVVRVTGGFAQPFSAFFDVTTNAWYVSNVAGDLTNFMNLKDGHGWITKISADYQTVDHTFFSTGLNAPAGLRVVGGKLYVPDVDQLVVIDVANRTAVRSATVTAINPFIPYVVMTDVVVDSGGIAYAPETAGSRIVKFSTPTVNNAGSTNILPSGVSFPTTALIDGTKLVVGTTGSPVVAGSTGSLFTMNLADGSGVVKLGTFAASFEGLEKDGTDYLVGTQRGSTVNRIAQATGAQTLLQNCATEGVVSVADIGWDATRRILAVPDVGTNSVYFYQK